MEDFIKIPIGILINELENLKKLGAKSISIKGEIICRELSDKIVVSTETKKKIMKRFEIFNIVEDKIIGLFNDESVFIHFVRILVVENEDEDMSITCLNEATEYINNYCDNLKLTIK